MSNLINKVLGISVCFIVLDYLDRRVISSYLKALILVSFTWLTLKHKERFTPIHAIYEDNNLESNLSFILATSCGP